MPLQDTGKITINDIAAEFGGDAPHGLTEYYGATAGLPTSGTIKNSDFYGKSSLANINFPGDWNGAGKTVWQNITVGTFNNGGGGIKKNYMRSENNTGSGYVCPPGNPGKETGAVYQRFVDGFSIPVTVGKRYAIKFKVSNYSLNHTVSGAQTHFQVAAVRPGRVPSIYGWYDAGFSSTTQKYKWSGGSSTGQYAKLTAYEYTMPYTDTLHKTEYTYEFDCIGTQAEPSGDVEVDIVIKTTSSPGNGCHGKGSVDISEISWLGEI